MTKDNVMPDNDFPVANLDQDTLSRVQNLEKQLQDSTDKELVLIAYEEKSGE